MRKFALFAALLLPGTVATANAQTQEYYAELDTAKSRGGCNQRGDWWKVTIENGSLSLAGRSGTMITVPVPQDGAIRSKHFGAPEGDVLQLVGNVPKGDYAVYNTSTKCFYRLVPKTGR